MNGLTTRRRDSVIGGSDCPAEVICSSSGCENRRTVTLLIAVSFGLVEGDIIGRVINDANAVVRGVNY